MKGIYVLILRLYSDMNIGVAKLGELHLKKGYYAYVGSARGTGGFKRVSRHFDVASGKNSTKKWHIDYILPHSKVMYAVLLPTNKALECAVANALCELSKIPGFGCTDCTCSTHLFFSEEDFKDRITETCNELTGNESIIISPDI